MDKPVTIITGASSGIGAATALRLAPVSAGLILHARGNVEALQRTAEAAREAGAQTAMVTADLSDPDLGKRLTDAAMQHFGRLDCVVANAGFPILKNFDEGSDEDLDRAFRGNAVSFFNIVRAAQDLLAGSGRGRVVAVGSFTSHLFRTDMRQFPMSAASKGALETGVKSLALHLAGKGVTVNCVVPGFIRKEAGTADSVSDDELAEAIHRIPLGRVGKPADVAGAIAFLLSEDAAYITGQSLHVNGGMVI